MTTTVRFAVITVFLYALFFSILLRKTNFEDEVIPRLAITNCHNSPVQAQHDQTQQNDDAVLVIASSPIDERHVVSFWSELECFVGSASRVIVSSPYWAEDVLTSILVEAREKIPHFASRDVSIEVNFYDNQRYDVGLWCDALQGLRGRYEKFILLNDSIFALRKFTGILDALRDNTDLSMTSLVYNADSKNETNFSTWVESFFRGFDEHGLSVFMNHSCVPQTHKSFCKSLTRKNPKKKQTVERLKKRCITVHHEVGLATVFSKPEKQVLGLFPGTVPEHMKSKNTSTFPTWVLHTPYWKDVLVEKYNFPAAKVNQETMIATIDDPLLEKCTRNLDRSFLDRIDFSKSVRAVKY